MINTLKLDCGCILVGLTCKDVSVNSLPTSLQSNTKQIPLIKDIFVSSSLSGLVLNSRKNGKMCYFPKIFFSLFGSLKFLFFVRVFMIFLSIQEKNNPNHHRITSIGANCLSNLILLNFSLIFFFAVP